METYNDTNPPDELEAITYRESVRRDLGPFVISIQFARVFTEEDEREYERLAAKIRRFNKRHGLPVYED